MIQKSYEVNEYGNLYLVPTPIGNLEDITKRAISVLSNCDLVYAEDTRETLNLLKKLNIEKKIESCHKYSEMKNKDRIIELLKNGKTIAYTTDRGTPLISDPGSIIVEEAIKNKINVIALPGANALLPALNMSGLSNQRFLFYGFLNSKKSIAIKELNSLKAIKYTLVFYESPFRIKETLKIIKDILGNRKIAIVREISKIYEEVIRGNVENIINLCENIKGEIVIVVEGNNIISEEVDYKSIFIDLLKKGYTKKDALKEISDIYNISKNQIYNLVKELE